MSNLIDEFDSNFEIEGGIRHAIVDIIESRRAEVPAERMVEEDSLFQVAERALESNAHLDADVRYFNVLREVTNFITFASEGAISENITKHTDLLPISHPASTAETSLTASALRILRAQWYASDPRIISGEARAIIASLYSSNPISIDYAYNLARLESLQEGQVPADLLITPLVAFGDPYAGKNSWWHRSMRAKKQRRDDEGQFAEMGGGYRFYVRLMNGRVVSVVGKVAGIPENDSEGIDIEVTGVKGIRDGIYTIPANYGHSFKAILPWQAVSKAVRTAKKDVPYVDIKDLVRKELPTSWFPTKTKGEVADLVDAKSDRSFATGDGYRANFYKKLSDDLNERVADAQDKFGSLVVSDQGTDTLNPDLPAYELISTKRGQPEVVGYAQDWATVQKLASDEDDNYPDTENEPIAESKATLPEPTQAPEAVEEPTEPEEPVFDPVATKPAGWVDNGDGLFTPENGPVAVRFGETPVSYETESFLDDNTGEAVDTISPVVVPNSFGVYDPISGDLAGIAFDWDGVEKVAEWVDMHEYVENMEVNNGRIDPELLLPDRTKLIENADPANTDPIDDKLKYMLYAAFRAHEVTPEMMDIYDEMASSWKDGGPFNRAQGFALLNAVNKQPSKSVPAGWKMAQWSERLIVRKQLAQRDIPEELRSELDSEFRDYDHDEIQSTIQLLNSFPLKGAKKPAAPVADKKEGAEPKPIAEEPVEESSVEARRPAFPGVIKALEAAFLNHSVTDPEMIDLYDDIKLNPKKHEYYVVQKLIDSINNDTPQGFNELATPLQRKNLRAAMNHPDGTEWRAQIAENLYKYTRDEAQALWREIIESPSTTLKMPEDTRAPKKTADEIARENGMEEATPEYLNSDVPVGQDRPTNRQLVMLEALIENRDFSSKSATDDLKTFMEHHRTMPFQVMQDYINVFKELPFKENYKPRQLTALPTEDGGPSPRMLRSLERIHAKGLIPEDMWQSLIADLPSMKLGELSDKYINPFKKLEALNDDAILRKSIEGGYEIAGLRIPDKSSVEIPADYKPTRPGEWIAPTEEEIDRILDEQGATPKIADTTIDGAAIEAAAKAKTSGEAEAILDKAEYDSYLQREALRADLKRARQMLASNINLVADAIATPRRILKADARKILEKAMTDLSALKAVMDLRRKNIPSVDEFNRRMQLIVDSILPGEDSPSPYGVLKTRTPEVLDILNRVAASVSGGIGIYSAGRFQYQRQTEIVEEMASNKPSMKFFYPPTFDGDAMAPLRAASSFDEVVEFLRNNDIYLLDLETTGLIDLDDPEVKNDPIQIAVTKVSGLQAVDRFTTYINPESKLSSYTLKGVGDGLGGKVTPEFLSSFPTKREAMEQLLNFIPKGSIIAGHNAMMFDLEVIERTLSEAGLDSLSPSGTLDTLGLARYLMPEWSPATPDAPFKINAYGQQTKSFSLEALVTYFGLSNNGRHEADADVASTVEVLQRMLDRAQRGLGVQGKNFDFEASSNGWTKDAYDAAKEVYQQQVGEYVLSRVSEILSIDGASQEEIDRTINTLVETVNRGSSATQGQNREAITIPKPGSLRDLHAGAYVFDTNDGRVGISLGMVGDNILVDMPSPDILSSGKFVIDKLPPSRLARVMDKFVSKNGILIDYGMEVSGPEIPRGYGTVRALTGDNDNVVVGYENSVVPVAAKNLIANPVTSESVATSQQESQIVNLLDGLVSEKVLDRATANGIQKAAEGHFYTKDMANKVILRLTNAMQQKRQIDANSDISVAPGENAAPQPVIEEMASRKPKDKITVDSLDKKKIEPMLGKLAKKPTAEMENIIAAITDGYDTVVKALAGTGKTSTLRSAAQAIAGLKPKSKILYVVFNKENQLEADVSMPTNTESRTSDSISFRAPVNKLMREKFEKLPTHSFNNISKSTDEKVIYDGTRSGKYIPGFSAELAGPRAPVNPRKHNDLVDVFDVKPVTLSGDRQIPAVTLARVAYQTLTNFVLSDSADISGEHIPADEMGALAPSNDKERLIITSLAQKMWDNITSAYDPNVRQLLVDQTHMFKNWALTHPNLKEEDGSGNSTHGFAQIPDILFLDEAQDINPAFLGLIRDQKKVHKNGLQNVVVGDTNQQIFGFRGTADSLGVLDRDITLPLTKSFRTGDGILKTANKVLRMLGEKLQLVGRDKDGSKVVETDSMDDPDLIITRTNTGILSAGVWADMVHPGERVATTAAFKDRLLTLVKTLDWIVGGAKPQFRPKQISPELVGFTEYDQILDSAENGDQYMAMIVRMISTMKKMMASRDGGKANIVVDGKSVAVVKTYEALKELERVLLNFRTLSDNFEVPKEIKKGGTLGGNISYQIIGKSIVLSNTEYMKHKRFGLGVWDNRNAIEDSGFTRVDERDADDKQLMIWKASLLGTGEDQIKRLVMKLRGEDAIMRIMTGHTVKGLEAPNVKLWADWKQPKELSASELRLYYVAITRAMDNLDLGGLSWINDIDEDAEYIEDMATKKKPSGPSNQNYATQYELALGRQQAYLDQYKAELKLPVFKRADKLDDNELKRLITATEGRIKEIKQNPDVFEKEDTLLYEDLKNVLPKIEAVVKSGNADTSSLTPEELTLLDRFRDPSRGSSKIPQIINSARLIGAKAKISELNSKLQTGNWLEVFVEQMATPNDDNVVVPADGMEGSDSNPVDEPKASGIRKRNQEVTDRIVGEILAQMENGMVPWRKPWSTNGVLPTSGATGRVYRGLNLIFLMMEMQRRGYQGNRFYTQNAINKLGGFLKDDAKPSLITKVTMIKTEKEQEVRKPDPENPGKFILVKEKVEGKIPRLDYDIVYNEDEIQGVEIPGAKKMEPMEPSEIEKIVLASYTNGPEIKFVLGDSAHWNPVTDTINLPRRDQFSNEADFLDTLFHELTHSTGHSSRLDRKDLIEGYGEHKNVRAREELIAEIGGAIISQMFNLDAAFDNSLSYIQGWSEFLKEEPNALFEASSLASKAVEHILGGYWASEEGLVDLSEEASYTPTEAINMPEGEITGETGSMGGLGNGVNYRIENDSIILMGNTKGNKDAIKSVSFIPEGGKRPYKFLYHSKNGYWFTTFTGEFAIPNRINMLKELKNALSAAPEAVEEMATPAGDVSPEMKAKLYDIVDEAAKFYNNRMLNFSDATEAVKYFRGRGFSKQDAEKFQLGYAPKTWATLYQHLLKKGYTEEEMLASGLIKRSERTGRLFDALRDRIVFPIKDADGKVVGFTGRTVDPNEDIRYMLTSNTPIYQKSEALFGLDQAKDEIAKTGEMIVVEGQFDALAMHAAGFKNAVATSGTAFGPGHVKLFGDAAGNKKKKSIIFSFDPDTAGTKAAESVYEMLKNSNIDLYAVSGESDMDPADIYSKDNEEGLKTLIDNKMSMLEYLIEQIIATGNVSSIEGRINAIKAIAKLLSGVEDKSVVENLVAKYAARLGSTEQDMMEAIGQNL